MATEPLTTGASGNNSSLQRRRLRVFAILFVSLLVIIAVSAATLGYWTQRHMQRALREEITRNLAQKAQTLANRVNADRSHGIDVIASQEGQAAGARATIVDSNGKVVADSEVSIASLSDEGRRPEFVTALHGSTGVETRTRNGVPVLYVAVAVSGGAVRLSYPMSDLEIATDQMNKHLVIGCVIAALAGLILSAAITRIVVSRQKT